jgi:hypothetical protein
LNAYCPRWHFATTAYSAQGPDFSTLVKEGSVVVSHAAAPPRGNAAMVPLFGKNN